MRLKFWSIFFLVAFCLNKIRNCLEVLKTQIHDTYKEYRLLWLIFQSKIQKRSSERRILWLKRIRQWFSTKYLIRATVKVGPHVSKRFDDDDLCIFFSVLSTTTRRHPLQGLVCCLLWHLRRSCTSLILTMSSIHCKTLHVSVTTS